jgi:hypothetical protein
MIRRDCSIVAKLGRQVISSRLLLDIFVVVEDNNIGRPELEPDDRAVFSRPLAESGVVLVRLDVLHQLGTYTSKDLEEGIRWRFPKNGFVAGPGGKALGRELAKAYGATVRITATTSTADSEVASWNLVKSTRKPMIYLPSCLWLGT